MDRILHPVSAGSPAIDDLEGLDRLEALVLLEAIYRRQGRRRFDRSGYAAAPGPRAAVGRLLGAPDEPLAPGTGRGRFARHGG